MNFNTLRHQFKTQVLFIPLIRHSTEFCLQTKIIIFYRLRLKKYFFSLHFLIRPLVYVFIHSLSPPLGSLRGSGFSVALFSSALFARSLFVLLL